VLQSGVECLFLSDNQIFNEKMRFLGNIEAKIDAKSRVFIPAAFRRILQAEGQLTLYLRKDIYQDCIVAYPQSVWEEELTVLRSRLNKWVPEEQELYRQFMLEAVSVEMDSSGRVLVAKSLLNLCGIDSDVRFLGVDNTIEIWPKELLEKPRVEPDAFKQRISALMGNRSGATE
jgi:MraZ protein